MATATVTTMADPVGLKCPGCGEPPVWLLGGGHQAFCGTDDCPWFTWDPAKTLAELNAAQKVIDIGVDCGEDRRCLDCDGSGLTPAMDACSACFGTGRAPEDLGHLTDGADDA